MLDFRTWKLSYDPSRLNSDEVNIGDDKKRMPAMKIQRVKYDILDQNSNHHGYAPNICMICFGTGI